MRTGRTCVEPAEWFAGFGYRVFRDRDSRFDLGAGLKRESPLNSCANARYRHYIHVNDDLLLTMRTTGFVEYGGVLFWADGPLPSDRCDACLGASIGFEVLFGDAYDRTLRRDSRAHPATDGSERTTASLAADARIRR